MKIPALKKLNKFGSNRSFWLIVVIVVLIVALIPAYYYYNQYKQAQNLLQNPSASANAEAQQLVSKVGELIELPTGETPTIATVSDVTKLANQPFFARAQNGDKVLIFNNSKEIYLYRPSENKIISVATLNATNPLPSIAPQTQTIQPSVAPTATPTPAPITIEIYNGTSISGLAGKAGDKITASMSNATIAGTGDANGNYAKTQVVDVSGNNSVAATQIANLLGGTVAAAIPAGETKPTSQILVIVGSNFSQ
jgi:cytoskeletal protein RodZ